MWSEDGSIERIVSNLAPFFYDCSVLRHFILSWAALTLPVFDFPGGMTVFITSSSIPSSPPPPTPQKCFWDNHSCERVENVHAPWERKELKMTNMEGRAGFGLKMWIQTDKVGAFLSKNWKILILPGGGIIKINHRKSENLIKISKLHLKVKKYFLLRQPMPPLAKSAAPIRVPICLPHHWGKSAAHHRG